jgi:hypothetical protein
MELEYEPDFPPTVFDPREIVHKITGLHADWTLTVHITPPDMDAFSAAEGCPYADFSSLIAVFRDLVNYYEAQGEALSYRINGFPVHSPG